MSEAFRSNVSGEAVRLDLPEAGLASRLLALAIDLIVIVMLLVGALLLGGVAVVALDTAATAAVLLVLTLAIILGLPVVVETATSGKSLGKYAMGLRVVTDTGAPIRFRHSFIRGLFLVLVDLWTTAGSVGLLTSISNPRGKRVGDYFAGTVVIRDRFAVSVVTPVQTEQVPAHWAAWANQIDTSRLPADALSDAVAFLPRRGELDPSLRIAKAQGLASRYAQALGVAPPAHADTEVFVLALTRQATFGGQ